MENWKGSRISQTAQDCKMFRIIVNYIKENINWLYIFLSLPVAQVLTTKWIN